MSLHEQMNIYALFITFRKAHKKVFLSDIFNTNFMFGIRVFLNCSKNAFSAKVYRTHIQDIAMYKKIGFGQISLTLLKRFCYRLLFFQANPDVDINNSESFGSIIDTKGDTFFTFHNGQKISGRKKIYCN